MAAVTLQDILEDLNYLMGDTSVPSSDIDNQKRFINRTIEKIYDAHDWRWATSATSYGFSGTTQVLPANFSNLTEVRELVTGSANDNVYIITGETDTDQDPVKYYAWVNGNPVTLYTLNINQTNNPTLRVTFKKSTDVLTTTADTTSIPRSMPIARGALAMMQEAEDPYRDTTAAWDKYQVELNDLVRLDVRTKPQPKFYTKYQEHNRHFGEPR